MPIQVACPQCGKKYRFSDERAGRTVECKECGTDIEIRRGRRGTKPNAQGSGMAVGVLIGGGVAGLTAIGLLAFVFLGRVPQPVVAPDNPVPVVNPPPGGAAPAPVAVTPPVVAPNGAANPVAPTSIVPNPAIPPQLGNPAATPKVNPAPAASGFQAGNSKFEPNFKPVLNWKVQVDPSRDLGEFDSSKKFNVKTVAGYLSDDHVLYPVTPSPFALIGSNSSDKEFREVWNLATATKGGQVRGPRITGRTVGLSPDAQYVAWYRSDAGGGVEVYDIPAKKTLGVLALDPRKFNVAATALPTSKRLVAMSDVNRGLICWKLPSGDLEYQIELAERARPGDRHVFSPGGRYLALLGDFLQKAIHIYDLDSGERVGVIEMTKQNTSALMGIAFSRDGKEFAAAYNENYGRDPERIAIWNVADGSLASEFTLPDPDQRKGNISANHTSLQWFPNGRRLLLNGMYVIDRESKNVVFAFAKPTLDIDTQSARRVLSDTLLAAWEGTKQSALLAALELKADDIARAQEVVAAGGLPFDAKLPKLTPFDRSKAADRTAIDVDWKAAPDPGPSAAVLSNASPLKSGNGRLREMDFSRPEAGIVCLRLAEEDDSPTSSMAGLMPRMHAVTRPPALSRVRVRLPPAPCRQNWLELYDMAKKETAGRIDIDFPCELMSVSPDGSRVLVQATDGEGRLDVFGADGQHVAGCRPFQSEASKEQREIVSAVFLAANTVAACSLDDRLIVFRLPSCEPIFAVDDAGTLAVSPGGKLIATSIGFKVELRDALTGLGRGNIVLNADVHALAFSPLGDQLAVLTTGRTGNALAVIDLTNGTQTSFAVPQAVAPLIWCGTQEVLLGRPQTSELISAGPMGVKVDRAWMLVDLARKVVLWSYLSNARETTVATKSFDGRLWLAGPTGKASGRQIAALTLLEPDVKKQLTDKQLESQAIIRPGVSVSLQYAVSFPAGLESDSQKARLLIDRTLTENGVTVNDGQSVRLIVSLVPGNTTGTMTLKSFGIGLRGAKPPDITVQRKSVALRLAYEMNGKSVWESKHDVSNDFFGITRLPEGKDAQTALDENMWKQALSTLERNLPPSHVFSAESARGSGTSRLTVNGLAPAGR